MKTEEYLENIDIYMTNVKVTNIPVNMNEIEIAMPSESDKQLILEKFDLRSYPYKDKTINYDVGQSQNVYLITSSGYKGFVIAGTLSWHVDERNYYEPSYWEDDTGRA